MAPSVLLQMVGPRVANHVLERMHEAFPDRFPLSPGLAALADGEEPVPLDDAPRTREQIVEEVLEAVADEVHRLLEESVVAEAADVDTGLLLGAGWPFFLGGITKHLDQIGMTRFRLGGLGGGFLLGAVLGLVFIPCGGPVLAALTSNVARDRVGGWLVVIALAYAIGAALPLLAIAAGSRRVATSFRQHAQAVRIAGGVLMLSALPSVSLEDGLTAHELATQLGTVLTWDRAGVTYILAGSLPSSAAEAAAAAIG